MEEAFQRERARVDRNRQVFSVVVLRQLEGRAAAARTAEVLGQRIRAYDTLGQLDQRRLALLLPETNSAGAWTLADDARRRLAEEGITFECEVYCYPTDWTPRADSDQERTGNGVQASEPGGSGARVPEAQISEALDLESQDPRDGTPMTEPADRGAGTQERTDSEGTSSRPVEGGPADPVSSPILHEGSRQFRSLDPVLVQPLSRTRRLLDILVAGAGLILLSPLLALIALAIKLDTRGPIFFVQKRAGLGGVPFDFFKFRSMYLDAERRRKEVLALNEHKTGPIFKLKNDPRITRVGGFLRRTSLDELPQLLNVLRGEMTLIGPRPPRLDEVEEYEPWQRRRLEVTGGLTCIWQVSGRSEVGFEDMVRMDLQYQARRSLGFDLRLLFRTVGAVLSGRGAF